MADPTGCGESTPCNRNPPLPFYTGFYPAPPRPVMRCAIDGGGCTPFRSGAASACRRWPSTCCSAGSGGLRLRGCLLGRFLGLHLHTMITVTAHGARGNRGPASGVQQAVDYTTQGRSGCVERMVALRSEHGSPGSMTVFARGAGAATDLLHRRSDAYLYGLHKLRTHHGAHIRCHKTQRCSSITDARQTR